MALGDCPRCRKPLALVRAGGLELDACRACDGLWFDKGELSRTLESPAAARAPEVEASWRSAARRSDLPGPTDLLCPRCGGEMSRTRFALSSPVLVDGCKKGCGLWLDGGELGELARYLSEHLRPASAREEALLREHQAKFEKAVERGERLCVEALGSAGGLVERLRRFLFGLRGE